MSDRVFEANLGDIVDIYHKYRDDEYIYNDNSKMFDPFVVSSEPDTPALGIYENTESKAAFNEWISPSDTLIGPVRSKPPFTSKIHRAKAHEGVLIIGGQVLKTIHEKFVRKLNSILDDNYEAWNYILEHQRKLIEKKAFKIYSEQGRRKCQTLLQESSNFFRRSLYDLENDLARTVEMMVGNAHAGAVSDLNFQIRDKLKDEKNKLDKKLYRQIINEIKKLEEYYRLLLRNEIRRKTEYINKQLLERDQTYEILFRHFEAENITSCMYVMSNKRRKCYIRRVNLANVHSKEISEKLKQAREKKQVLEYFQSKLPLAQVNKDWEEKTQKIIQLFMNFISFSLKLLPQQTLFLLELKRLLIIQMDEILKNPLHPTTVLVNMSKPSIPKFEFIFPECEDSSPTVPCPEPFTIEGTFLKPFPKHDDSKTTLSSNEDLPYFRVQREYYFARCDKFDEIKTMLKEREVECSCSRFVTPTPVDSPDSEKEMLQYSLPSVLPQVKTPSNTEVISTWSLENRPSDHFDPFVTCPLKCDQKCIHELDFPNLNEYLDFNEKKYQIVKDMLLDTEIKPKPELIKTRIVMDKFNTEYPFGATKPVKCDAATQCCSEISLHKDEDKEESTCSCTKVPFINNIPRPIPTPEEILQLRKQSLLSLIKERPSVTQLFTDEWVNFLH